MPIEIEAKAKPQVAVKLVGVTYKIKPPKAALAMKLGVQAKLAGENPQLVMDALGEWIVQAFGAAGAKKIHERLDDPKDDLDIEHIMALMEAVVEAETSGNPTGSRSASARSRSTTGRTSTAGRRRTASKR